MANSAQKEPVTLVYIGRTLPGLSQYTVFKNGYLPYHVRQMVDGNKFIRGLIVPVKDLQAARKNMQIKGHILNFYATHLPKNKER